VTWKKCLVIEYSSYILVSLLWSPGNEAKGRLLKPLYTNSRMYFLLKRYYTCSIQLFQLRLSPEQSGKVEYERERLLGIANKFIHLLAILSNLSRSYSTFPLCSGDNLNWNSCICPSVESLYCAGEKSPAHFGCSLYIYLLLNFRNLPRAISKLSSQVYAVIVHGIEWPSAIESFNWDLKKVKQGSLVSCSSL
jgi:hypothetical protein